MRAKLLFTIRNICETALRVDHFPKVQYLQVASFFRFMHAKVSVTCIRTFRNVRARLKQP